MTRASTGTPVGLPPLAIRPRRFTIGQIGIF
jgi:hypothetical protein